MGEGSWNPVNLRTNGQKDNNGQMREKKKKRSNQQHSWLQGQVQSPLPSSQLFPQAFKDNFLFNEALNHTQINKMPRPQQDRKPQQISLHQQRQSDCSYVS